MKIMIIAVSMILAACSSTVPLEGNGHASQTVAFATLAFGPFEMKLAPAYTRLAVLRHKATVALRSGAITVSVAKEIQAGADRIRANLDLAKTRESDSILGLAVGELADLEKKL